jgi:hypothetical protein
MFPSVFGLFFVFFIPFTIKKQNFILPVLARVRSMEVVEAVRLRRGRVRSVGKVESLGNFVQIKNYFYYN